MNITFQQKPVTLEGKPLKVGDQAPSFTVLSKDLKDVTYEDYKNKIKLISVVPSVDTGVCSLQTQRFHSKVSQLEGVELLTISMDLPFAQQRWIQENNLENVSLFSDHREASFGQAFGTLIKELRLLTRSIFVIDENDIIKHVEYVSEVSNHPDYDAALEAAKSLIQ